jgi:hypothetical protein
MADAERPAGERVDRGDVGGAVVGQEPLDGDPVAGVEGGGAAQEADRHPFCQPTPAVPAECGVTVELHPVPSLDWGA